MYPLISLIVGATIAYGQDRGPLATPAQQAEYERYQVDRLANVTVDLGLKLDEIAAGFIDTASGNNDTLTSRTELARFNQERKGKSTFYAIVRGVREYDPALANETGGLSNHPLDYSYVPIQRNVFPSAAQAEAAIDKHGHEGLHYVELESATDLRLPLTVSRVFENTASGYKARPVTRYALGNIRARVHASKLQPKIWDERERLADLCGNRDGTAQETELSALSVFEQNSRNPFLYVGISGLDPWDQQARDVARDYNLELPGPLYALEPNVSTSKTEAVISPAAAGRNVVLRLDRRTGNIDQILTASGKKVADLKR